MAAADDRSTCFASFPLNSKPSCNMRASLSLPRKNSRHPGSLAQWLAHIESVHYRSIDLQLDRVYTVLQQLFPQGLQYRMISVAGTNGKGSAVEMMSSILCQAGYRVGTYTSPHLVHYTERIRVNLEPVDETVLSDAFERIEHARGSTPLTYFEFSTLAALQVFQDRGIEIAVLEVGMGGRLDAVNAVDACAALITSVAIDHQHWLGSNREVIGAEKSGILRPSRPAVCADPEPPAAVLDHADSIGAELYLLGKHFSFQSGDDGWDWYGPAGRFVDLPRPRMLGAYQLQNAAGAVMVLMALADTLDISESQLRNGLASARLRGRFEVLPGGPDIILDVAHNLAAISELKANLESLASASGRTLAVCGMLQDKPISEMSVQLDPVVDAWYVGSINDPRGCPAEDLAAAIEKVGGTPVYAHPSVEQAFNTARADAGADDRILVFGSFHTVGDIIALLETDSVVH